MRPDVRGHSNVENNVSKAQIKGNRRPRLKSRSRNGDRGPAIKVGIGVETNDRPIVGETGGPVIGIETGIETGGPAVKAGRGRRGARRSCHLSRGRSPNNQSRDSSRNRRHRQHSRARRRIRGPVIKLDT